MTRVSRSTVVLESRNPRTITRRVGCVKRLKTYRGFGGSRTRKTADAVQRKIRTGEGLSAAVSWKPRRHVASSLEIPSFNEGGPRAAEETSYGMSRAG
jgi:hypothetical protein